MIEGQAKAKTMPENMNDQSPENGQNDDTNADFHVKSLISALCLVRAGNGGTSPGNDVAGSTQSSDAPLSIKSAKV